MAKKPATKTTKRTSAVEEKAIQRLSSYYASRVAEIDKKLDMVAGQSIALTPISTGSLVADYISSGGIHAIFCQVSGPEGAGKSSLGMSVLGEAVRMKVPLIEVHDAEGSITPEYANNIFRTFGLDDIFVKGGPANYYDTDVLEDFSERMSQLLKMLPNKVWNTDIKSWAYSIQKGSSSGLLKALEGLGLKVDKSASDDTRWIIPTEYGGPEGFVMLDSWMAIFSEKEDEEGQSGQMAGNATPLNKNLRRFAARFRKKGVAFYSTNQIRENPGQRYGSPLYEPGGNALKHFSQFRMRMFPRAVPQGFERDKESGGLCIEEDVSGEGYDYYAFKALENTKHKLGRPFMKGMIRIWVADKNGEPRGIDPVFDTIEYLKMTGQLTGNRKKYHLQFRDSIKGSAVRALEEIEWSYETLKEVLIYEHFGDRNSLRDLAERTGFTKVPHLRENLFQQVRGDKGLYGSSVSAGGEDYEEE